MDRTLQFAVLEKPRPVQKIDKAIIDAGTLLKLLSQFNPYGLWQMELATGLLYWTEDIFEIYGLPVSDGPVSVKTAIEVYHPDDRPMLIDCLDDAVARKSGFHFVLRIAAGDGYKLVKTLGMYHVDDRGREWLIGTFCEDPGGVRGVVIR